VFIFKAVSTIGQTVGAVVYFQKNEYNGVAVGYVIAGIFVSGRLIKKAIHKFLNCFIS
jgi:hypothetical protein